MGLEEYVDMLFYISEHMKEWPLEDQLLIMINMTEFVKKSSPIVLKHMAEENGGQSFLFKF